jgi:hypothetical protein
VRLLIDPGILAADSARLTKTEGRPKLLLLFAPAEHPHRDAACATIAWLAAAEGRMFECYYDSRHTGVHFGGGLPWLVDPADLRGGTFTGGHHLEQFQMVVDRFECEAVCLGETVFGPALVRAAVPIRASSADIVELYRQVFAGSDVEMPQTLLVVGPASEEISAIPYACHEIGQRRVLAIADGDADALARLRQGRTVEHLWSDREESIESRSRAMAERWSRSTTGYLLADPEVAGRWIPAAVRNGWAPVYGIPQVEVVDRLAPRLEGASVVWGRQQDDADLLALSKAGVAFQLVDPGRPPFPVLGEVAKPIPFRPCEEDAPSSTDLIRWAEQGKVLTSVVFWAGMVRELECFYTLSEVLQQTGLKCGVVLTTESFKFVDSNPLSLLSVKSESGGLGGQVEVLLASAGIGAMLESAAPPERFSRTLRESVSALADWMGGAQHLPRGWWGVMDAPLLPRRIGRVSFSASPPAVKLRYRPRPLVAAARSNGEARADLRSRIRRSPLASWFEPIRPFDESRPGPPLHSVLSSVRSAGFEYALTKSEFGLPPTVVTGVEGLTVLNYTAGRWDGWTPFETINNAADVARAETDLLRGGRPGWLLGGFDSCLWTFSGYALDRGRELRDICRRLADGGASGKLVNVTPGTLARYARILAERGAVRTVPAS